MGGYWVWMLKMSRLKNKPNRNEFEIAVVELTKHFYYKITGSYSAIDEFYISDRYLYTAISALPKDKYIQVIVKLDVPSMENAGFSFTRYDRLDIKGDLFYKWQTHDDKTIGIYFTEYYRRHTFIPDSFKALATNGKGFNSLATKHIYKLFNKVPKHDYIRYTKDIGFDHQTT